MIGTPLQQYQVSSLPENIYGARNVVRRERLFKVMVLSGPEFDIEDEEERRVVIAGAWEVWDVGMRRIGQ